MNEGKKNTRGVYSIFNQAEERISNLEDRAVEIIVSEEQKEKK